ncbi:MAG: hypothetical protein R3A11_00135 [Bdellovibrionota bacterium]
MRAFLQKLLLSIDGGQSLIVMGMDGLLLDEAIKTPSGESLHQASVEYCQVLKETMKVGVENGIGQLKDSLSHFENSSLIVKIVTPEYFVALLLSSEDGQVGKARYQLEKNLPLLRKHLV